MEDWPDARKLLGFCQFKKRLPSFLISLNFSISNKEFLEILAFKR